MLKNYDRYKNIDSKKYNKFSIQKLLWRKPSDKIIIPEIKKIKNLDILDVGIGTAWYAKVFLSQNNKITGVDINPHLCEENIEIIKAKATDFASKILEKKEMVFSSWTSEYLSPDDFLQFLNECKKVLKPRGILQFTIIANKAWGSFYIKAAKLKGIIKYNYSKKEIEKMLVEKSFSVKKILNLNSYGKIPWAYYFECEFINE